VSIHIASHFRTVPLINEHAALNTPETGVSLAGDQSSGDVEVWIAQVVAQRVSDCRTNHWKNTTAVYVSSWIRGTTSRRRLAEPQRCCRSATLATGRLIYPRYRPTTGSTCTEWYLSFQSKF